MHTNELLLKACQFGADDLCDGDLLMRSANRLYAIADSLEKFQEQDDIDNKTLIESCRNLATGLLMKHDLQRQALEATSPPAAR